MVPGPWSCVRTSPPFSSICKPALISPAGQEGLSVICPGVKLGVPELVGGCVSAWPKEAAVIPG